MLVRNAITLTAARFLNAAEKAGREKYQDIPQLGDIYIRLNQIGYEFLEDIYYPIGGLSRLANSPSIKGFQKQLRKKAYG